MSEFRERLTAVETLVGKEPTSGLRGDVADLRDKADRILDRLSGQERRMAVLVGGILVVGRLVEMALPFLHK